MNDSIKSIPDAIFAEPTLTTTKCLLASGHHFYCYRFDRVSPGAAESNFLAQHTAELRYLFGTLTADGYDGTDRRISAWMQAQWVAFARDGAPADGAAWRPFGGEERILVIGDEFHEGRIEDDPVVPLLHRLRTISRHRQQDFRVFGADCGTETGVGSVEVAAVTPDCTGGVSTSFDWHRMTADRRHGGAFEGESGWHHIR